MIKQSPLAEEALRLRNANPQAFDKFVGLWEQVRAHCAEDFAQAQPSEILIFQGRVQAYAHIIRILKECHIEPAMKPLPPMPQAQSGV